MAKSYSEALEGIFTPETTVRSLLDNVRETLVSKYTDLEAAEKLAAQVEAENGDILKIILNIANTMAEVHNGAATKEDAMATVTPMVKTIKEKCVTLGLTDAFSPDNDISEVELDMLKQFITECRTLIEEHINALRDTEGSDLAGRAADLAHGADTEETEGEEAPEDDVEGAEESVLKLMMNGESEALEASWSGAIGHTAGSIARIKKDWRGSYSTEAKTGTAQYKEAKKMYKSNPTKAMALMKQARSSFDKAIKKVQGMARHNAPNGVNTARSYEGVGNAISDLYDWLDRCDAYILKWSNKAGKSSVDEIKAKLKEERKAERAAFKERKAADKAARKEAKVAEKAARKAAKEGNAAAATEALIAMLSYATEGKYEPDLDDTDAIILEATISMECLDDTELETFEEDE